MGRGNGRPPCSPGGGFMLRMGKHALLNIAPATTREYNRGGLNNDASPLHRQHVVSLINRLAGRHYSQRHTHTHTLPCCPVTGSQIVAFRRIWCFQPH